MLPGCGPNAAPTAASRGDEKLRVLFIGNSLTAGNDLPHMVQAMAAADGIRIGVEAVTRGGFGLEDHWNYGLARNKLGEGKWDFVVLQQGPSSKPEGRAHLKRWAKTWADEVRKAGAKAALYMVWPFEDQENGFTDVSASYRAAAEAAEALILPAGDAWRAAMARDPGLRLYREDKLHPTGAGTYLAALVITRVLTGVRPSVVPASLKSGSGQVFAIPEEQVGVLRQVAEKVSGN
jgi:hypothetical protein